MTSESKAGSERTSLRDIIDNLWEMYYCDDCGETESQGAYPLHNADHTLHKVTVYDKGWVKGILKKSLDAERARDRELAKRVVTLCGSVRFRKDFEEVGADLCFAGYAVLSLSVWGTETKTGYIDDTNPLKKVLEAVHFKKIDLSEAIVIINKNGYIGRSTKNEIEYARSKGKAIYWLEGDGPNWKDLIAALSGKGQAGKSASP